MHAMTVIVAGSIISMQQLASASETSTACGTHQCCHSNEGTLPEPAAAVHINLPRQTLQWTRGQEAAVAGSPMDYLLSDGLTGTQFKYSMFNPHAASSTGRSLLSTKSLMPAKAQFDNGPVAVAGSATGVDKFLSE